MNRIYSSPYDFLRKTGTVIKKKQIVFTNGCFDIIHPGHIHILKKAKEYGDILIVGLNSDKSVKKIKGSSRPIMDEESRADVLAQLKPVDFVVFFDEETPLNLIKALGPDVLIKGGEYSAGEIVGEDIVPRTIRVKMKGKFSTTKIIKKIKESALQSG